MKAKFVIVFLVLGYNNYAQIVCHKTSESKSKDYSIDFDGSKTKYQFDDIPENFRYAINKVQNDFNVKFITYVKKETQNVCHKYNKGRNAELLIGLDYANNYKNNDLLALFIIAHEAAHTMQGIYYNTYKSHFKQLYNSSLSYKLVELQCDVIAAHYVATFLDQQNLSNRQYDIKLKNLRYDMQEISDEQFFTKDGHHGNFLDRTRALRTGILLSKGTVYGGYYKDLRNVELESGSENLYYHTYRIVKEKFDLTGDKNRF